MGLSEDEKHVMLISGSPIQKEGQSPYLVLGGAEGYLYGETTLNTISNLYHNNNLAEETRSIKIEDINHALGLVVDYENNTIYKKEDSSKTNVADIIDITTYTYKIGDYAPENYLGVGMKRQGDNVTSDFTYIYSYKNNDKFVNSNSILYDILFKGTESNQNNAKAYWLANQAMAANSRMAALGIGAVNGVTIGIDGTAFFISSENTIYSYEYAVRPIVILKESVTIDQVTKRQEEVTEPTWTTEGGKGVASETINQGQVTE